MAGAVVFFVVLGVVILKQRAGGAQNEGGERELFRSVVAPRKQTRRSINERLYDEESNA